MSEPTENNFPSGWDEEQTRRVLEHYENQTDEEAAAEDDARFVDQESTDFETWILVPKSLVPAVQEMIEREG